MSETINNMNNWSENEINILKSLGLKPFYYWCVLRGRCELQKENNGNYSIYDELDYDAGTSKLSLGSDFNKVIDELKKRGYNNS